MFKTALIDGDQMMHVIGATTEEEPLAFALGTVKKSLEKILKATEAEGHEIWIGGKGNFRDSVSVSRTYKGTRTPHRPRHFDEIKRYLVEYQGAQKAHGMEADDMLSARLYSNQEDHVVCTQDKDLLNTPGWHFNPRFPEQGVFHINEEEAHEHFWYQMLTGDSVDNIPGLPALTKEGFKRYSLPKRGSLGCGDKRALEIVMQAHDLPKEVWALYQEYHTQEGVPGMALEYFQEQGELLWMAREITPAGHPVRFNHEWYKIQEHPEEGK